MTPSLDLSSDHSPTFLTLYNEPVNLELSCHRYPNKRTNWLKYKKYVSAHIPHNLSLKSENEVEAAVNIFTKVLVEAARVSTPPAPVIKKKLSNCPDHIECILRQKRKLRRQWQQTRSPGVKAQLNRIQKLLRSSLQSDKELNLKHYLEKLTPTDNTNFSLWKATSKMRCPTTYESPIRLQNGEWAKNSVEKLDEFANHLQSVFTPNVSTSSVNLSPISEIVQQPMKFRLSNVRAAVKGLKTQKAPGNDKITATMIINLPMSAMRIILFIFNSLLRVGIFPSAWKLSDIKMIPKPGKDLTQVTSYRPISLLPILSKLFEKMFLDSLVSQNDISAIIPNHQFGFRRKHSTVEQVHRITNLIRGAFENKQYCSALFIDISQAFDKVWHDGLLFKITRCLPESTHKLLKSYLTNRSFRIRSKDDTSSTKSIHAGVPQGSILGPFLYILFTADMPTSTLTHTSTFADDTAIMSINKNPIVASECVQEHINVLEAWLNKWKIKVNAAKCVHITFTLRRDTCPHVLINNIRIPQQNHVKYLGIHLDRRLTWSHHIAAKISQIKLKSAQLYWLVGQRSALNLDLKVLIYKAILKPIWLYGIQIWGTASPSNIEKLQRRQSKLLRLITCAPWFIKNSNIHKDLNILTIKEEIRKATSNYIHKLPTHPNPLARDLLSFEGHRRLKRRETADLIG